MRLPAAFVIGSIFFCAATASSAQEVYKWKDKNGVSHYSQSPPASGAYTMHQAAKDPARSASAATGAATALAGAATGATGASAAVNPQCANARKNITALEGKNSVQLDSDGDGKLDKTLSAAERANQLELAKLSLKAYNCEPAQPAA